MVSAPFPSFDPDRFSLLRAFLRWSARRALRWFYRETVVVQMGVVPDTGPVLFVGNHPNDLPDVLLGLQACPRHVRYLATIAAGAGGAASKGYEAMGVIPVTRVRDARKMRAMGVDMAAVNAERRATPKHQMTPNVITKEEKRKLNKKGFIEAIASSVAFKGKYFNDMKKIKGDVFTERIIKYKLKE